MQTPNEIDLTGVTMPRHLRLAINALDLVAGGSKVILTTDQDVVMKYVPSAAARLRIRVQMSMPKENLWKLTLTPTGKET